MSTDPRPACDGMDGDLWFPTSYGNAAGQTQTAHAIAICHRCPIRAQCLTEALASEGGLKVDLRHGIRGGATPQDRYNQYRRTVRNTGLAA